LRSAWALAVRLSKFDCGRCSQAISVSDLVAEQLDGLPR
jgi:hypothetical protein